jgi:hypothetical protein
MTKKNIQYCSLVGLGRMTVLRALGHRGLGEDDGAMGKGTAQVDGVMDSGMTPGAQHHRIGEDNVVAGSRTASWAWG